MTFDSITQNNLRLIWNNCIAAPWHPLRMPLGWHHGRNHIRVFMIFMVVSLQSPLKSANTLLRCFIIDLNWTEPQGSFRTMKSLLFIYEVYVLRLRALHTKIQRLTLLIKLNSLTVVVGKMCIPSETFVHPCTLFFFSLVHRLKINYPYYPYYIIMQNRD